MYSFRNDYSEGAHPDILKALSDTNMMQEDGYGEDRFSLEAAGYLKHCMKNEDVDVHFLSGGTQTNLIAISAFLRPHEAVISAHTGHVLVHEAGAIEATGHKIISLASDDGKLTPAGIQSAVDAHTDEHMVKPALVYISQSTEVGSIYSKAELESVRAACLRNRLFLLMDGARLGSALCAQGNDLALSDLPDLTDAFYIGGTKNGAMIGEALVIANPALKADFRFHMKQKGALLAKGRLLGIQFRELFRDDLFFRLASHANRMAGLLRTGLTRLGYVFLTQSPTNMIFPVLPNMLIERLQKEYAFYVWSPAGAGSSSIRLVTSWATQEEAVASFLKDVEEMALV